MKKYYIQSRVRTGSEILSKYIHNEEEKDIKKRFDLTFEYEWLHFEQWDFTPAEWALGDAWIIKNEIIAQDINDAVNKHLRQMDRILPKLFFWVPVWHFFWFQEPLLISLYLDFREWCFFLRKEREWVWLTITDEILEVLRGNCFQNIPDSFFLWYSEFINAKDSLSALSLWLTALECIRPYENKDKEKILWKDLFYKIYGKVDTNFPERKEWIRHRIHHGRYPMEWDDIISDQNEMHDAIYKCLLHINPEIQKVYEMRSQFVWIPRQKTVIEWFGWVLLVSENQKPIKLNELNKYADLDFSAFQKNISSIGIKTDFSRKVSDY